MVLVSGSASSADAATAMDLGAHDYLRGPVETVECFRLYYGPTQKAFESLDIVGQRALRSDLEALWSDHNQATDGTTRVESEYLEVRAIRA